MMTNIYLYILKYLIIILASLYACVWLYYKRQYQFWKKKGVPHTRPRFPLGNIARMCFRRSPGEVIADLHNRGKGNRYVGIWLWFTPAVIVRDPDLIRNILVRDFDHFHDRVPYVNLRKDPLSGHAFSLRGSRWRSVRPKLTPAFTSGKMKSFFNKFVDYTDQLVALVENETKLSGFAVLDMREVAARFTTDVAVSYALGVESHCLQDSKSIFREMGKKVFAPTYFNCIRSLVPLLIYRAAKLISLQPTVPEVADFFLSAAREMLAFREKAENANRNDFLQCLVELKKQSKLEVTDKIQGSGQKTVGWTFSSDEAAAQAFIFFIAGFETSSLTMQYALYELALNQDMQNSLRSEISHVLAKYDGKITYEGMNEMTLLQRILQETLRKYPVVPVAFRTCTKDYQVPDSDLIIPKGMQVLISSLALHRDPDLYPDPEKFEPDRFTEEAKANRHPYSYLPFGHGPRNCLGMRFSLIQKKLGIIALISNFKFQICDKSPMPHRFNKCSFFLTPKGGMHLMVTKIVNKA